MRAEKAVRKATVATHNALTKPSPAAMGKAVRATQKASDKTVSAQRAARQSARKALPQHANATKAVREAINATADVVAECKRMLGVA